MRFERSARSDPAILFTASDRSAIPYSRAESALPSQLLILRQAALRSFQLGKTAAFLLDQVIFGAAFRFSGIEDLFPRSVTLTEQHTIGLSFAGAPVLQMQ